MASTSEENLASHLAFDSAALMAITMQESQENNSNLNSSTLSTTFTRRSEGQNLTVNQNVQEMNSCGSTNSESNLRPATEPSEELRTEADPLPRKVGEIGYVPPTAQTANSPQAADSRSPHSFLAVGSALPSDGHRNSSRALNHGSPLWTPVSLGSAENGGSSRGPAQSEKISATKMFLKPSLLVIFGSSLLGITSAGFAHAQERANHNNRRSSSNSEDEQTTSGGSSINNLSFVYIGAVFMVAILVEIWLLVGSFRNLYHRLGVWVDQEYPLPIPNLSEPDSTPKSGRPLPLWAKLLKISPKAVRQPPLPSYTAALNIIGIGRRSGNENQGTGDVEDGEVIRTLAIGQGQAAPAFDGDEFRKSTVLLTGPPKRLSVGSNSAPANTTSQGFMRSLSRRLSRTFGSFRSSATQENEEDIFSRQGQPGNSTPMSEVTIQNPRGGVEVNSQATNSTTTASPAHHSRENSIPRQGGVVV